MSKWRRDSSFKRRNMHDGDGDVVFVVVVLSVVLIDVVAVVGVGVAVAVAVFVAVIMLYDDASQCLGKAIIIVQMWKSKNVEILSFLISHLISLFFLFLHYFHFLNHH